VEGIDLLRGSAFGDDADLVVGDLEKTAFNMELSAADGGSQAECAIAQECHQGGVVRENTEFAVESWGDDSIDVALEEYLFWRNDGNV
jgi:hypothetical protein